MRNEKIIFKVGKYLSIVCLSFLLLNRLAEIVLFVEFVGLLAHKLEILAIVTVAFLVFVNVTL